MKTKQLILEAEGVTAAFAFGRFNPAHQGHIEVWRTVEQAGKNWFVGTNPSTLGVDDPLPFDVKTAWMAEIYPPIAGHIVPKASVLELAAYIFKKLRKNENATVAYITDATDWAWSGKLLNQYNGVEGQHGYYKFAQIIHEPSPRVTSASELRKAARADDKVAFYQASGTDPKAKVGGKTYFDTVREHLQPYMAAEEEKARAAEERARAKAEKERLRAEKAAAKASKIKPTKEGVDEGVNDPHTFKCIFLFGPMGAGKSTVARPLLTHTGLRSVNLDNFNEMFIKKGQVPTGHLSADQLEKSWQLSQKQQDNFMDGRLGIIIDGSGRNPNTAVGVIEKLQPLGYEFMMIFVNVSEATSIARQQSRADKQQQQWGVGRQVDPTLAKNTYDQVQKNLSKYSAYFGPERFVYVDNENTPDLTQATKKVDAFLRAPVRQPEALAWIQAQKGGQQVAQRQQKLATAQDRQQQALKQYNPLNPKFNKQESMEQGVAEDSLGLKKLHDALWTVISEQTIDEETINEIDPGMIANLYSVFPTVAKIIVSNALDKARKEAKETSIMIDVMKKHANNQPVTPEESEAMKTQFKDIVSYGLSTVAGVLTGAVAGPATGAGVALAGAYKKELLALLQTKGPEVLIGLLKSKGKLDVVGILSAKLLGKHALPFYAAPKVAEEKQRLDAKCWTGYKKQGTKMKGDTRVNNCVKESALDEKSVSKAQFRTMAAVAHNPKFAKKVGISQEVGKEFHSADKNTNYKKLPKKVDEILDPTSMSANVLRYLGRKTATAFPWIATGAVGGALAYSGLLAPIMASVGGVGTALAGLSTEVMAYGAVGGMAATPSLIQIVKDLFAADENSIQAGIKRWVEKHVGDENDVQEFINLHAQSAYLKQPVFRWRAEEWKTKMKPDEAEAYLEKHNKHWLDAEKQKVIDAEKAKAEKEKADAEKANVKPGVKPSGAPVTPATESLDADQKRVGQVGSKDKARQIGQVLAKPTKQHPYKGRLVGEDKQQGVAEAPLKEMASKLLSAEDRNGVITVIVQAPDGTKRSLANDNPNYIQRWLQKYGLVLPKSITSQFVGVHEEFNGEYDDEAGMAKSNLLTTGRAVAGLLKIIQDNDNLPEWGQEKIAKAEMMLVSIWDYLQSQKEQGIDPKVEGVTEADIDFGPEWDEIVKRVGQRAKQGPLKTVWDEKKRVYRNVPVADPDQPSKEVDEASLATMRDYFAGNDDAKDPTKIAQMRDFFNKNKLPGSNVKDKRFASRQAYELWLKQNGLRDLSSK